MKLEKNKTNDRKELIEIKKVAIIGLGALGILFGKLLSEKLPWENLRFIADTGRIARYQAEKIFCNGSPCDFQFVTPEEKCDPADLVIFTVKYQGLNAAIEAVKNQMGKNTIILSALNGIISEEIIGRTYGTEHILYCVAQGMDAVKEGNRLTYEHTGMLVFGEKEKGQVSAGMKAAAAFFDRLDFPYQVDTDMKKRLWGKFMMNVGVNQTVSVFEGDYGTVQKEGIARATMISAMREVIALSEKEGINLTEEDLGYWLKVLSTLNPLGKPSMRQDLEAGRFSEVDLFAGTILELGRKHEVAAPVNQMLYSKIKFMETNFRKV